jgi:hypothetical protein
VARQTQSAAQSDLHLFAEVRPFQLALATCPVLLFWKAEYSSLVKIALP